jgi:hypothetical protein
VILRQSATAAGRMARQGPHSQRVASRPCGRPTTRHGRAARGSCRFSLMTSLDPTCASL